MYLRHVSMKSKLNIPRLREVTGGVVEGWRTRQAIKFVKAKPELKEVMDLLKLAGDLHKENAKMDSF